jgi:hypothetical protein
MAISNLVSPGQASERPSVSAFFGQSYTGGATQKVSSTMMSDSFVDSTMNMLKGLNTEIARIQTTAKKTLSGFDKVINSIRDLNRNITMRFRTLNNELTASRVDFLRGVLGAPEAPPADLGGAPILVMKNDQPVDKPTTPAPTGPMDIAAMIFDALGNIGLGKSILQGFARFALSPVGLVLLAGTATFAAFAAAMFSVAKVADMVEDALGLKEKYKARMETQEYKDMQETQSKIAEDARTRNVGGGDRIKLIDKTLKDNNLTQKDVKSYDKSKGIITTKDDKQFDINTQKPVETVTPAAAPQSRGAAIDSVPTPSGGPAYQYPGFKSIRADDPDPVPATPPPAVPATPPPAVPATPPPGAPTRGSLRGALDKSMPITPPATTGGASEGEVKAEQKKETGDSKIINTNKFKPARAKMMSDDEVNVFEGFKTSEQKSMANQMISDVRNPTSNIDRGSADEFEIIAKLERGERVDPNKPPGTMTKRELANRISDYGMPALASGAYSAEEFKNITKQAGQEQWKSNAQEKAGEWIKNQSAETMAKKSFKPLVPPVVMNNSSTTNNNSSSGGEGNNVSGQNFPLTAINPHIQEFLQKQNMQYQ